MSKPHTDFTADWFTQYGEHWLKRLGHLKDTPIRFLEIGCYEGRSTCWLLDNLLTHKDSYITCIDPWDGKDPCLGEQTKIAYNTFRNNTIGYGKSKVVVIRDESYEQLLYMNVASNKFDIVFIDGNHEGYNALGDLILSWPLVKPNGWLIMDDYHWSDDRLRSMPRDAWNAFSSVKPLGLKEEIVGRLVFAQRVMT